MNAPMQQAFIPNQGSSLILQSLVPSTVYILTTIAEQPSSIAHNGTVMHIPVQVIQPAIIAPLPICISTSMPFCNHSMTVMLNIPSRSMVSVKKMKQNPSGAFPPPLRKGDTTIRHHNLSKAPMEQAIGAVKYEKLSVIEASVLYRVPYAALHSRVQRFEVKNGLDKPSALLDMDQWPISSQKNSDNSDVYPTNNREKNPIHPTALEKGGNPGRYREPMEQAIEAVLNGDLSAIEASVLYRVSYPSLNNRMRTFEDANGVRLYPPSSPNIDKWRTSIDEFNKRKEGLRNQSPEHVTEKLNRTESLKVSPRKMSRKSRKAYERNLNDALNFYCQSQLTLKDCARLFEVTYSALQQNASETNLTKPRWKRSYNEEDFEKVLTSVRKYLK